MLHDDIRNVTRFLLNAYGFDDHRRNYVANIYYVLLANGTILGVSRDIYFDGETYIPKYDEIRLNGQLLAVYSVMQDGGWHTLSWIRDRIGKGSEAAISARLRDLRKARYGAYEVQRRRKGSFNAGLFEYRLVV